MRTSLPLVLFLSVTFAGAQAAPAHPNTSEGFTRTQIRGIDIPPIPGAPFTAKVVVTWNEPLVGGGTISRTYYTRVARDAQGRVRRETRGFVPANSAAAPPLRSFSITDPVAATRITCTPNTAMCTSTLYQPRLSLPGDPATDEAGGALPTAGGKPTRVSLGQQRWGGVSVVGIRETAVSTAGDSGTSRTIVSSRDLWYSPDLKIDMLVVRNNPQMGQLTLTVTNLVRGDPDPSLLAPPSGYQTRNVNHQ